ncbi:hypothetical protein I203_100437 [Kwoniella mangroviensis CBS 8507]|uniref:uncharacterized protein n=1 Tax=Kwoniella mangroviensis CBS 8507 TaxID=1296122 RepID=UPI003052A36A
MDQPKRPPSKRMAFCVDELVHVGQLWDVYRGDLIGCDGISKPQHLILKLMRPNAFPDEYPSDPDDPRSEEEGYHIKDSAIAAAFREDWIYRTRLVQLQGTIVPEYHGLFTWYDPLEDKPEWPYVFAMIMEDAGDADKGCREGSYYWEWEDILRIDRMYSTLHETAGLIQNAVADQHIIRSKDNQRLSLVDFQDARIFQECKPERRQHLLNTEDGEFLYMVHAFRK